ncbi:MULTISPECIES: hypothetical protein [Kitasatospora]|uniref:Secreted protein n=1 Tax=Kitasatospora setae (strain ATCC 33774 / DSM 43861 / JCM 3304 / KCC A-0304 / NBRC 14216 / KM-6054) TaxID=452652 RepID=E4N3A6_KITSK|nr:MULTISPECIES: hypothetical protein [Kitasatospora]BAJ32640.1 hypothetical protein KSE_68820 [Kitasatospora setae KM-6054]
MRTDSTSTSTAATTTAAAPRPHRLRRLLPPAAVAACAALLAGVAPATAAPAAAAAPGAPYTGMGNCPVAAPAMHDPSNLQVGCLVSVTNAGKFTLGNTVVPFNSPITLQFGFYWDKSAPEVSFPDGSTANQYTVVPPTSAPLLSAPMVQINIPGIQNYLPGITSVFAQVELAGPVTKFTPLATGEPYPVFQLPIKLHLYNALFGAHCYVGSDAAPLLLKPTTGSTAPAGSTPPMTGDPGTIGYDPDPNGHNALVISETNASLVDNTFAVPGANGCGLLGSLNQIINWTMGLPAAPGKDSVSFQQTNASFVLDTDIADLTAALGDSTAH